MKTVVVCRWYLMKHAMITHLASFYLHRIDVIIKRYKAIIAAEDFLDDVKTFGMKNGECAVCKYDETENLSCMKQTYTRSQTYFLCTFTTIQN